MTQAPAPARSRSGGASLQARLFPGDRRLWLCAAVVIAVGAIAILVALLVPRDYYTGTNSIRTRGFLTMLTKGDQACVPDVQVPAGTGRIQVEVDTGDGGPLAPLTGTLSTAGGRKLADTKAPAGPPGRRKVDFPVPAQSRASGATFCVRAASKVFLGGVPQIPRHGPGVRLNGKPYHAHVAMWFRPPAGERRSLLSHPGAVMERAALMRPGWVGPWTYWMLLLVVMPLLGYAALRLLANAEDPRRSLRRLAVTVGALGLLNACAWALITTPFNAPDESEHFAYVQYFAETGHMTQREGTTAPRPVYSAEEDNALGTVQILAWNESYDGRPPWTGMAETRLAERQRARPGADSRDSGGGPTAATWAHSPAYYATLAPGYLAGRTGSPWDELTLARFLSGLYVAIAAACAFLLVREIVPAQRVLAAAAGLLVAFHPMFGFIGGAVNNDNGVNGLAAVTILLTVRALRRGLTVPSGVALGVIVALTPIMKGTGFALYPLLGLAGLGLLVQRHSRRDLIAYAAAIASVLAAFAVWSALSGLWDQPTAPAGGGASASTAASGALDNPLGYLSYLWQIFLPPLPFMTDLFIFKWPFFNIYIERGWGAFGWYAVLFPKWVYALILAVTVAVGALAVRAALRNRDWVRRNWLPVAFVVLVPVTVIAAVESAYYTTAPRPALAEFGRYLFPAMTALAALAVGSCLGLGRRWAPVAATGLVCAVIVLDYASQLLSLAGFYT